jgi:hypothetical protein
LLLGYSPTLFETVSALSSLISFRKNTTNFFASCTSPFSLLQFQHT